MQQENLATLQTEFEKLRQAVASVSYGTVSLSLTLHDGLITLVSRGVAVTIKAPPGGRG